MGSLSTDEVALLELREEHGLDPDAIAEVVGISSAEARKRLHSADAARDVDLRPSPGGRPRRMPTANALIWGAAVVLFALAALAFAGVFDGADDPGASYAAAPSEATPQDAGTGSTTVRLTGAGGAHGTATFGLGKTQHPFLDLRVAQLPASKRGEVDLLWIDNGTGRGLPLPTLVKPGRSGTVSRRIPLDRQMVPVLDLARSIQLVTADASSVRSLQAQLGGVGSGPSASSLPRAPGRVLLSGALPG